MHQTSQSILASIAAALVSVSILVGCGASSPSVSTDAGLPGQTNPADLPPVTGPDGESAVTRHRYALANDCFALRSAESGQFVTTSGAGYRASAATLDEAEAFYFKPTMLGSYLLMNRSSLLLQSSEGDLGNSSRLDASAFAEWEVKVAGDTTVYPPAPQFDTEPDPDALNTYRDFADLNLQNSVFTLTNRGEAQALRSDNEGNLAVAGAAGNASQFALVAVNPAACADFPEAQNNVRGVSFSGLRDDGRVLGFAESHVHIVSTTFLGGALWGQPYHRYGVEHALADCSERHGNNGENDATGALFAGDFDGHATDGWPSFSFWPSRGAITHEGAYYTWLERAWLAGLRIMVNHLVENETLCEIQRNAAGEPAEDCNEMDSAMGQLGTLYAMQDYIDAQYGGRNAGWLRVVRSPEEARAVIADGKLAVVVGMELSHLMNCKVTYNGPAPETRGCDENEIDVQLQRITALGITQLFPIHQFDNALGGSAVFTELVINLGNRGDTGGLPAEEIEATLNGDFSSIVNNGTEPQTGEFWSTYNCPPADDPAVDGYLYGPGSPLQSIPTAKPFCTDAENDGYDGGAIACYDPLPGDPGRQIGLSPESPDTNEAGEVRECNARWLTDLGLYALSKIMIEGIVLEVDHLELEVKNQLLDLTEAQPLPYPVVSSHGGHGGISFVQARRIFRNGGFIYPYKTNGRIMTDRFNTISQLHLESGSPFEFAMGYGSDVNGLGPQGDPRSDVDGKEVRYPFSLFSGPGFDEISAFDNVPALVFEQHRVAAPDGSGRSWSIDEEGQANYGMIADYVEELRQEGNVAALEALYNSAEVYLQMWERTVAAGQAIRDAGAVTVPAGLLRTAPTND